MNMIFSLVLSLHIVAIIHQRQPSYACKTTYYWPYNGQEAVLVLLDYSAAFDTIDHNILFERLKNKYGIGGTALNWFVSYLENRVQAVVVEENISDDFPLPWGVPQGSVKGPLDFVLYTGPLSDVISAHKGIEHITC